MIGSRYRSDCFYTKVGATTIIYISIDGLQKDANSTIFILPEGYRPHAVTAVFISNGGSNPTLDCKVDIWDNGNVVLHPISSTVASGFVTFPVFK